MELKVEQVNGRVPVTLITLSGDIDSSNDKIFLGKVNDLIENGTRYVLFDLAKTSHISSAGMRALHTILTHLRALTPDVSDEEMRKGVLAGTYKSPHLKLLNPTPKTLLALELLGFDMYIESFNDRNKAIAAF